MENTTSSWSLMESPWISLTFLCLLEKIYAESPWIPPSPRLISHPGLDVFEAFLLCIGHTFQLAGDVGNAGVVRPDVDPFAFLSQTNGLWVATFGTPRSHTFQHFPTITWPWCPFWGTLRPNSNGNTMIQKHRNCNNSSPAWEKKWMQLATP